MAVRARVVMLAICASACGSKTGLLEPLAGRDPDAGVDAALDAPADARPDATADGCVPGPEQCNALDDDCDGVADDGIPCFFADGQPIEPVPAASCGAGWYSYDSPDTESANPMPDIRRSGEVVLAIQYAPSCGGAYLAVIADLPNDGSGGQLDGVFQVTPAGGASIVVADEPGECDSLGGDVICNWVWQPCCTDGVLIGPFVSNACVLVRLDNSAGVSGLFILDGAGGEIPRPLPATLEICTTFVPAVN